MQNIPIFLACAIYSHHQKRLILNEYRWQRVVQNVRVENFAAGKCHWYKRRTIQYKTEGLEPTWIRKVKLERRKPWNTMEYNAIPWKTQTMIAANSCMTLFLSFSLSLSRSPTQNRTRQASAKIPSGRKRMRKLPNEVNEGATSPNKCSELQSSCV